MMKNLCQTVSRGQSDRNQQNMIFFRASRERFNLHNLLFGYAEKVAAFSFCAAAAVFLLGLWKHLRTDRHQDVLCAEIMLIHAAIWVHKYLLLREQFRMQNMQTDIGNHVACSCAESIMSRWSE